MAFLRSFLRIAILGGLLAYFVAASVLLVTRYWVLPRVNEWRPEIERVLSESVGVAVKFDSISADWYGLNASLRVKNLRILDEDGVAQLGIPRAEVIVSWRSLLELEPVFRYVGVDDVVLVARRSPTGRLTIGGFTSDESPDNDTPIWRSPTSQWLMRQGRINVKNARVIWIDQQRKAEPLVIPKVDLTIDNGLLQHEVDLRATLPKRWGGEIELVAKIDAMRGPISNLLAKEPDGVIYASISRFEPIELSPWVDVPKVEGAFAARTWLSVSAGKFQNLTINVVGKDAKWSESGDVAQSARAGKIDWQASGPIAMWYQSGPYDALIGKPKSPMRWDSRLSLENGYFQSPLAGMQDINADQVTLDVGVSRLQPNRLAIQVNDAAFSNSDGLVTARGSWVDDGREKGGVLDIEGALARFQLPSLHKYLPHSIGQEAHDWLKDAFKSGIVSQAAFKVKGAVDDFPFSANRGAGTFSVDGTYQDWTLDYAPGTASGELAWPLLGDLKGSISLLNDRISTDINAGAVLLPGGQRISIGGTNADLIDLENKPVLSVQGTTHAQAKNFLGLFEQTALRDLAPEFVRDFAGEGRWTLPIKLKVPIDDLEATTFVAELQLNGGSVSYLDSPALTDVTGAAVISETGFTAKNLAGQLLGGTVTIQGSMGADHGDISVNGRALWADVAKYTKSSIASDWLSGQISYNLTAKLSDGHRFNVELNSDLTGTGVNLPAPLGKAASQRWASKVTWNGSARDPKAHDWALTLGNHFAIRAISDPRGNSRAPFFSSVAMTIGGARPINSGGLTVSAQLPLLNIDDWTPVADTLERELKASSPDKPSLFPVFVGARLRTPLLHLGKTNIENVDADLRVLNGRSYNLSLSANQTNGSVTWEVENGHIRNGFNLHFDRLALGQSPDVDPKTRRARAELSAVPEAGSLSKVPPLAIEVEDLTLYGSQLGSFRLVGRNSADARQWLIEELKITNPHGQLTATGANRYYTNPGIELDAKLQISNLGDLTKFIKKSDPVRNGEGTISAKIDWKALPWRFDYADLSGQASVDLKGGVFDHVNSSSARVLELLSLQSLGRLLSVNANPDDTFADGFPWNTITGQFDITNGVVDTKNLTVDSPVATISLTGGSNLVNETWDLKAVVRPNLDLSGTALATGFLVNPLVGLGALIGQYLLRHPVEDAMSEHFTVTGSWKDPVIGPKANDKKSGSNSANKSPSVGF